jgi:Ca2+-binding EF-hand superfamily protein
MGGSQGKLTGKEIKDLQRAAPDYTAKEIREWHKEYRENCQHGSCMTPEDFKDVYNSVFPGDASGFTSHLFRSFDTDGDGKVDFREFIVGLSISSSMDVEQKLKWAFNMYDVDGNGSLSYNELLDIIRVSHIWRVRGGGEVCVCVFVCVCV